MVDGSALRIAFSGLLALAVAMGVGRFAFTPILPMMQEDAGITVAAGGWLASANYLGYLAGSVTAMMVRLESGIAIRGGLLVIGVSTLAMGLTDSYAAWGVLRLLAGVGSAWVLIAVASFCLAQLVALGRQSLFGLVFAGVGTGIAVVGLLCIALMRSGASSAQAWIVAGIVALLASGVSASVLGAGREADAGDEAPAELTQHAWHGEHTRLVLCYGAVGFGYIIPATFLPVMAKELVSDPALFGWSWPVFGAAAVLSVALAAVRPASISNRSIWIASYFVMAAGIVLPVVLPGIAGIMLAALLVGGTFVVTTMVAMQEARAVAGGDATGLMAAMTASFALTQVLGPLAVSWTAGNGGGFTGPLIFASGLLVAAALALWPRSQATELFAAERKDSR